MLWFMLQASTTPNNALKSLVFRFLVLRVPQDTTAMGGGGEIAPVCPPLGTCPTVFKLGDISDLFFYSGCISMRAWEE